jgi:hypothetical protein
VALENIGRRLTLRGMEMAILAIGLAAALGFQAVKDWRFRKQALIIPAVLAFIGLDRLAGPGNIDPWVWLQQSTLLLAAAAVVQGAADHLLLSHALSAGTRRLATSALPLAAVSDGSAAAASEPATAVILTALTSCQEADFRFPRALPGWTRPRLRRESRRSGMPLSSGSRSTAAGPPRPVRAAQHQRPRGCGSPLAKLAALTEPCLSPQP